MSKKKPKERSSFLFQMMEAKITVDGVEHVVPPINYQKIVREDGTVEESGSLPVSPLGKTMQAISDAMTPPRKKRAKK